MKLIVSAICCAALSWFPALAQSTHASKSRAAPMTDQQFVDFAAQTDMLEAHLGQMAETQAEAQAVKDYAQMLITDHTNDYQHLGPLAEKIGLSFPRALDAEHDKMIEPFEKLRGASFDRRYIHEMIEGHTAAITTYKKVADDAQNEDLRQYASETLPTLEKHLDGAKDLLKKGAK